MRIRFWLFIFGDIHTEPTHAAFALRLALLEERGARLAGLEAARRDAAPETPDTTACAVDLLVLTPPGIGRSPLHYCRRDMDGRGRGAVVVVGGQGI